MKSKIKTRDQLKSEGWRVARDRMYLGESVGTAKYFVSLYVSHYMLGNEITILDYNNDDKNGPNFKVRDANRDAWIPWVLLVDGCPDDLEKHFKKHFKVKSFNQGAAHFALDTKTFEFDCKFKKMPMVDAKKVAKWILEQK